MLSLKKDKKEEEDKDVNMKEEKGSGSITEGSKVDKDKENTKQGFQKDLFTKDSIGDNTNTNKNADKKTSARNKDKIRRKSSSEENLPDVFKQAQDLSNSWVGNVKPTNKKKSKFDVPSNED